jgi:hypothetical protein
MPPAGFYSELASGAALAFPFVATLVEHCGLRLIYPMPSRQQTPCGRTVATHRIDLFVTT